METKQKYYNIYAGLKGSLGGATYQYTVYSNYKRAMKEARYCANCDYKEYEGYNGIPEYDSMPYEEYLDVKETFMDYYVIPTLKDTISKEDIIYNPPIDDNNDSCKVKSTRN